jgi:hypothetical protein
LEAKRVKWLIPVILLSVPCLADEPRKPRCNAQNQGRLWPEEANSDYSFRQRAAQAGELEMCARGLWRYGWEALTVHVNRLRKEQSRPNSASRREAENPAERADR